MEAVFSGRPDITVRSAGLDSEAPCRLDAALIAWADEIYVMETRHREKIRKKFRRVLGATPVITLGIPDEYESLQPELVAPLKERLLVYVD